MSDPGPDGEGPDFRDSRVTFADPAGGTSRTISAGERSRRLDEATGFVALMGGTLFPEDDRGARSTGSTAQARAEALASCSRTATRPSSLRPGTKGPDGLATGAGGEVTSEDSGP